MHKTVNFLLRTAVCVLTVLLTVTAAVFVAYRLFPLKYAQYIEAYSKKYGVDPCLSAALIKAESNFNVSAVSHAGAYGIMQITEETFLYCSEKMGIKATAEDIFDADKNIRVGIWYFASLLKRYNGNVDCAVAAYNAGAANVDKWLADKSCSPDGMRLDNVPYGETNRHIKKINMYTKIYKILYPNLK